jgi:hypothetical protein
MALLIQSGDRDEVLGGTKRDVSFILAKVLYDEVMSSPGMPGGGAQYATEKNHMTAAKPQLSLFTVNAPSVFLFRH